MSHRISLEKAKQLREKELKLQQEPKNGGILPRSDRRRKKYLRHVLKQQGYIAYLKARYKTTGRSDLAKLIEEGKERKRTHMVKKI